MAGFFVRQFFNSKTVMEESFRNQTIDMVKEQTSSFGGWIILTSTDSKIPPLIDTERKFQRMFLRIREKIFYFIP